MKILVTGGTSWFGQSIVRRLLRRGHEVACFDEAQSEPTFSDLDEDKIEKMEAFVPDDEVCKDLPDVVRPKGFYHLLISRSLAKKIDAAGMTGSGYVEPDRLLGDDIPVSLRGLTRK